MDSHDSIPAATLHQAAEFLRRQVFFARRRLQDAHQASDPTPGFNEQLQLARALDHLALRHEQGRSPAAVRPT